jgi:molybdate transport system ATP-binding protein
VSIVVDVHLRRQDFALDAAFRSDAKLTALSGPSGSGKTTIVNIIAGITKPDAGFVSVGGRTLLDTKRGIALPVHKRAVGVVFQEGRLFPHFNVRHNLMFGRWFARRGPRHAQFEDIVRLLGIAHLLERRPASLSGGEKQRVAIGRALLADPEILLMDEPLASLDETRKAEIYPYVERVRDAFGTPILWITHSEAEITRLAAHVVRIADGRISSSSDDAGRSGLRDGA